jgi:hypothetical protein
MVHTLFPLSCSSLVSPPYRPETHLCSFNEMGAGLHYALFAGRCRSRSALSIVRCAVGDEGDGGGGGLRVEGCEKQTITPCVTLTNLGVECLIHTRM